MSFDITPHIKARSDQLNADDIIGGPITVTITGATKGSREQPVILAIDGGHQPWKPCKTALRVLAAAWGTDALVWVGRQVKLHRDPSVRWSGVEVGGIRPSALSHIDKPLTLSLAVSRGKKAQVRVGVLRPAEPHRWPDNDRKWFCASISDAGYKYDHVAEYCEAQEWPRPSIVPRKRLEKLLAHLQGDGKAALDEWITENHPPAGREPGDEDESPD